MATTNGAAAATDSHVTAWELAELQKAATAVAETKRAVVEAQEAYLKAVGVYDYVWAATRRAHDMGPRDEVDVQSGAITRAGA